MYLVYLDCCKNKLVNSILGVKVIHANLRNVSTF